MSVPVLTQEQEKGVKASIFVILLVLVLFALILVAGDPIMDFRNESPSLVYVVAVYIPIMALCVLTYRRVRRK